MIIAGNVGIGLVWGWLLVLVGRDGPGKRPFRNIAAILIATSLVSLQLILFTDWRQLIVFAVTAVIAFSVHLAWLARLRREAKHS